MDILNLGNATLVGLAIIGVVNVVSFFYPKLGSKEKFAISVAVALAVGFIPADLGTQILNHIKDALIASFAVSGAYKLSTKMGGNK